jgi:hypothetical protein
MGARPQLPLKHAPSQPPERLARALQPPAAALSDRQPTAHQPRSQPLRAGQLGRGAGSVLRRNKCGGRRRNGSRRPRGVRQSGRSAYVVVARTYLSLARETRRQTDGSSSIDARRQKRQLAQRPEATAHRRDRSGEHPLRWRKITIGRSPTPLAPGAQLRRLLLLSVGAPLVSASRRGRLAARPVTHDARRACLASWWCAVRSLDLARARPLAMSRAPRARKARSHPSGAPRSSRT